MLIQFVRSSKIRPGPFGLLVVLGLLCWFVGPSVALACTSDPECDDGEVCTGVEWCDLTGGPPGTCMPGTPIVCDDSDPCTVDFCVEPAGTCDATLTLDAEAAAGPDGVCDTADDNIDLYGVDGLCGTGDDTTGDGVCALLDNCDDRTNPGQEDSDRDGSGDACDSTPCRARGLYTFSGVATLYRVDPATGEARFISSGFANPREIAIDGSETHALVTGVTPDRVYLIDLESGSVINNATTSSPWGVDFGSVSGQAYFAGYTSGEVWGWDLAGGLSPLAFGLIGPVGLDVDAAETTAYVTDESTGEIVAVDLATGGLTYIIDGFLGPTALALDPTDTYVYFIEPSGTLYRLPVSSGGPSSITGSLVNPEGLALNDAGTVAYVNDWAAGYPALAAVDLATGVITPLPQDPSGPTSFNDGIAHSPRPPVKILLQELVLGPPSSSVVIPVDVDDLTGLGILSIDFTVEFNPAVITVNSVALGTVTSGCTLTDNLTTPGRANISIFCTADLTGSGSIAEITWDVVGIPGQGSPLLVTDELLNEGTPAACGSSGALAVPVDIDGVVVYYRDEVTSSEPSTKVVDAASVDLEYLDWDEMSGPVYVLGDSTTTDCNGDYEFLSIPPVFTFRLTPSKSADFEGAVDPFDAALNAQHVVGLITLTANQSLAADVTGNGTLTSYDSARIAQFSVGLITQFPVAVLNGNDWAFVPAPQVEPNQTVTDPYPPGAIPGRIEYAPITESAEGQDFHAILYGDVSGNWVGVCGAVAPTPESVDSFTAAGGAVEGRLPGGGKFRGEGLVKLPNLRAAQGEEIRVPIRVDGAAEAIAFLLDLRYDPAVLELLGAEAGGDAASFQLQANTTERGRARMALFSASKLDRDGEIVVVRFRVIGSPRSRSDLTLATSRVNEGKIPVAVREGRVVVSPRPSRQ